MKLDAERFSLLVVTSLVPVTMAGVISVAGVSPLLLLPSLLPLAFALAGPNPRLAPWRDALTTLFLAAFVANLFIPKAEHLMLKRSLGALAVPGIVFLFVAYAHRNGIGAGMRRFAATGFGRALKIMNRYVVGTSAFAFFFVASTMCVLGTGLPKWLLVLPIGGAVALVFGPRVTGLRMAYEVVAFSGLLISLLAIPFHLWPKSVAALFFWSAGMTGVYEIGKPRPPKPAPLTATNETAPTR